MTAHVMPSSSRRRTTFSSARCTSASPMKNLVASRAPAKKRSSSSQTFNDLMGLRVAETSFDIPPPPAIGCRGSGELPRRGQEPDAEDHHPRRQADGPDHPPDGG